MDWITGFVILLAVGYIGYLVIKGEWNKLRENAYKLMLKVERLYSDYQGEEKFQEVFEMIYYGYIPEWLRYFITEEFIINKLQEWYDDAKDFLKGDDI